MSQLDVKQYSVQNHKNQYIIHYPNPTLSLDKLPHSCPNNWMSAVFSKQLNKSSISPTFRMCIISLTIWWGAVDWVCRDASCSSWFTWCCHITELVVMPYVAESTTSKLMLPIELVDKIHYMDWLKFHIWSLKRSHSKKGETAILYRLHLLEKISTDCGCHQKSLQNTVTLKILYRLQLLSKQQPTMMHQVICINA